MTWGSVYTEYGLPLFSDHSPMMITIKNNKMNIRSLFRFFNVWSEHPQFVVIVNEVWQKQLANGKMEDIWKKLKTLKPGFKKLNTIEYKGITQKIERTREYLITIQEQLQLQYSDTLLEEEVKVAQTLEKWSLTEESILRQKSRVKWIKLGDENNKYFSVVMKERATRKQILELTSANRDKITTRNGIRDEMVQFYYKLIGTAAHSLPTINKEVMKNGPILTHEQQLSLSAEVTEQEIQAGLWAISKDKALGVDGYNSCFFKKA
ncbi:uncharacterized protein LOC132601337 [Lycium barbarum]|uniref:uncharacterized protein LOC132601337 n=1 Tax=Lycium barbarum TaxID=112863 RepID=UPI00293E085E|nr:uncharacterized protein LOC132601337 [Lycium barbarum]